MTPLILSITCVARAITISHGTRPVRCTVPCLWPTHTTGIITTVHIDDINVDVTMSMESEAYYPALALKHKTPTHWIGSTRMNSDIPMPYFSWAEYNIQTPPPPFHTIKRAALFVASNCGAPSRRLDIVKKLMAKMPVVSTGKCINNAPFPRTQTKHDMMRNHALYLAFENSIVPDYITEKLWGAYSAGTIPVYYGAPNIKQLAPNNSFVDVTDFPSVHALAEHLNDILESKPLYDSYHAWRYHPLPKWFRNKYNFTHTHSACRVCQKAALLLNSH